MLLSMFNMRHVSMFVIFDKFLVCICCFVLSYLSKLKRSVRLVFSADFLYAFSSKYLFFSDNRNVHEIKTDKLQCYDKNW